MADDKLVSRLLLIGIAVVILAILITQYMSNKKAPLVGGVPTTSASPLHMLGAAKEYFSMPTFDETSKATKVPKLTTPKSVVMPNESVHNELYKAVDFSVENKVQSAGECAPRDKNTVADLLPKDAANSKWAQANPAGTGSVTDQNYLNAGYLAGINTVGQSLKNANHQLRSDPPIEKANVGPWSQSTIEYDVSRRFFEIGDC